MNQFSHRNGLINWCQNYSEPTHRGDPIDEFLPIQGHHVNFLDVTNDGLKPDVNPNRKANKMWAHIEHRVN